MLLIFGKESPTTESSDVYMEPLLEEMLELWRGTLAYDASTNGTNHKHFMLKGVLICTINNFPAYGLISSQ